ncbi:MAG: NADPH-dependent 7-cyano-7-deazaguanine reductase QueF [Lysobacterales bacterium]
MHDDLAQSALGKSSTGATGYDPTLLFAVSRAPARMRLEIESTPGRPLPFEGEDVWTAYELSWLNPRGMPQVAIGELRVPATSPNLVESKSLKLYLNGFNCERMENADALRARVIVDLARATGSDVRFSLSRADALADGRSTREGAESLDDLDVAVEHYGPPQPDLLADPAQRVEETLVTNTFKSNCPVTGQPDFATVWIRYRGPRINRESLLRYLVSFREHAALHEHCVERMFCDIHARCEPKALAVAARFTRRGGLDINPQRASPGYDVPWPTHTARQ